MTAGTGHSSLIQGIGVCAMTRNAIAVVQGTAGAADAGMHAGAVKTSEI